MKKYTASCHCQAVQIAFEVGPITEVLECNCSHCAKKSFLLIFLPTEQVTFLAGEEHQTEYRFNKKTIAHLFCKTCGVQVYTKAKMGESEMSSINVRTIDDFDTEDVTIKKVNGKDW